MSTLVLRLFFLALLTKDANKMVFHNIKAHGMDNLITQNVMSSCLLRFPITVSGYFLYVLVSTFQILHFYPHPSLHVVIAYNTTCITVCALPVVHDSATCQGLQLNETDSTYCFIKG